MQDTNSSLAKWAWHTLMTRSHLPSTTLPLTPTPLFHAHPLSHPRPLCQHHTALWQFLGRARIFLQLTHHLHEKSSGIKYLLGFLLITHNPSFCVHLQGKALWDWVEKREKFIFILQYIACSMQHPCKMILHEFWTRGFIKRWKCWVDRSTRDHKMESWIPCSAGIWQDYSGMEKLFTQLWQSGEIDTSPGLNTCTKVKIEIWLRLVK